MPPEDLQGQTDRDPAAMMASGMLEVSAAIEPMHDWLAGERAHFLSQGYTEDQAKAMAAATYVTAFGAQIRNPEQP